jgi:hypothetical protein
VLDIPDPLIDEPAGPTSPRVKRPSLVMSSPVRAWSMWGGLGAAGVICAATIAHAASRLGRALGGAGAREA